MKTTLIGLLFTLLAAVPSIAVGAEKLFDLSLAETSGTGQNVFAASAQAGGTGNGSFADSSPALFVFKNGGADTVAAQDYFVLKLPRAVKLVNVGDRVALSFTLTATNLRGLAGTSRPFRFGLFNAVSATAQGFAAASGYAAGYGPETSANGLYRRAGDGQGQNLWSTSSQFSRMADPDGTAASGLFTLPLPSSAFLQGSLTVERQDGGKVKITSTVGALATAQVMDADALTAFDAVSFFLWKTTGECRLSFSSLNVTFTPGFIWGVQVHSDPGFQSYEDVPRGFQLDLLNDLGASHLRTGAHDVPGELAADLTASPDFESMDALLAQAEARGIEVHPTLRSPLLGYSAGFMALNPDGSGEYRFTVEQVFDACYREGKRWAERYKGRITTWELANEIEAHCIISGRDGDKKEDYDDARYARCLAVVLGLSEGVADGDPDAKRIVGTAGWRHYGFIDRLIDDNVQFEILAWHWYSEMQSITRVLSKLQTYGKPIWVNECDRRKGSLPAAGQTQAEAEQEQAYMLKSYAYEMRKTGAIQAFFAYELLDQPYRSEAEANYGLVAVHQTGGLWEFDRRKPAFYAYREAISALKRHVSDVPDLVVDNSFAWPGASASGFARSTALNGYYLHDYLEDGNSGKGTGEVVFYPWFPEAGYYEVFMRWPASAANADNVPVTIYHRNDGIASQTTRIVNQQIGGSAWQSLGAYPFQAGVKVPKISAVVVGNAGTSGVVVADAVMCEKVPEIETENLNASAVSNGAAHAIVAHAGMSGGKGTSLQGASGDSVVYDIPNIAAGTYLVQVCACKGPSAEKFRFATAQGTAWAGWGAPDVDLNAGSEAFADIAVATVTFLNDGPKKIRFTVLNGGGRSLLIDYVRFLKQ